jgi:AGZA family xanthine/uracil permease-like MFS transporter
MSRIGNESLSTDEELSEILSTQGEIKKKIPSEEDQNEKISSEEDQNENSSSSQSAYSSRFAISVDNFFEISKNKSSIKVEIFSGIATFLAMAYILVVNPIQMQGFGLIPQTRTSALIIATIFGSFTGTALLAVCANMPIALAPGMGLSAMVGSYLLGPISGFQFTYSNLMIIVFISGLIFAIISIVPAGRDKRTGVMSSLREKVFVGVPEALRLAIPVGVGLFITFIGLRNANVIVPDQGTTVALVNLTKFELGNEACQAMICLFGFVIIAILSYYKIQGAVLFGVFAGTILAIPLKVANLDIIQGKSVVSWKFWENFEKFFSFNSDENSFLLMFTEGFNSPPQSAFTIIVLIITFAMIDMFDSIGTDVGCATNAGLLDERGFPKNYNKMVICDSIATCVGAVYGTSIVTTFVESGAGIAVGGKTGLTALTTACLFLLSVFLMPIFHLFLHLLLLLLLFMLVC